MIITCWFTLVKGNNEAKQTYDLLPHIVALTMLIELMGGGFIGQSALFVFMCPGQVFASLFMNLLNISTRISYVHNLHQYMEHKIQWLNQNAHPKL
jgi:hypothetical protein